MAQGYTNNLPIDTDDTLAADSDSLVASQKATKAYVDANAGTGDVVGPAGATDNAVARYDTTTGKLIQDSGVLIDDSDNLTANNLSGTNTGDQTSIVGITGTKAQFNTAITDTNALYINDSTSDLPEGTNLYYTEARVSANTDVAASKVITDFITVTQPVNLDDMESDIAALANGMIYKGDWDASAGSFPGSGSAQIGWFYYVSVGGTVDSVEFNVGDNIVAIVDNASTSTYASNWSKHDQTDAVQSVAGKVGAVTLVEADLTNLGTAIALVADNLSVFAATTSAQLAGVISDETGSGALVFATSPTLVTPALGTPASGVLTNCTGLPATGIADGTDGELITWGTDGSVETVAVGTSGQVLTSNGAGAAPTFQAISATFSMPFSYQRPLNKLYEAWPDLDTEITITALTAICESGSITATWSIDGTNITTGVNTVTTTQNKVTPTGNNVVNVGDDLEVTFSSNSLCINAVFTVHYTRAV